MLTANIVSLLGSSIKLFAYLNYADNGMFYIYASGHVLICISAVIVLNMTLIVNKHLYRDVFSQIDAIGAIVYGLAISTLMVNIIFYDHDKFFTKSDTAAFKNYGLMIFQASLFGILLIFKLVKRLVLRDNQDGQEHLISAD